MKLSVKAIPSSSRDCISGWLEDDLKVKVRAPAEKGKANKSVRTLLANTLNLPVEHVSIVTGETSQLKIVEITSLDELTVRDRLAQVTK